ncbi:hypothetical protein Neosp_007185 [[Neocosmospora] mangrovei]
MYKEMRPMAFQDLTVIFLPSEQLLYLPLKVVLPPPRQYLQNLTLIAEISQCNMMEYQELALHLLGVEALQWFNGYDLCFLAGLRKPLERRRGQKVVQLPRQSWSPFAESYFEKSFTFE